MSLTQKEIDEFKKITKDVYKIDLTDEEAQDQGERLVVLAELLVQQTRIEIKRKNRLTNEPQGFHLDSSEGIYSCILCHQSVSGETSWWDLNGIKCLNCQRNINEGIIPAEICRNGKLWFTDRDLSSYLKLHSSTIKKLKTNRELYGRDLKNTEGKSYLTVYLVYENKIFLNKYLKKKEKISKEAPIMADKKGPIY